LESNRVTWPAHASSTGFGVVAEARGSGSGPARSGDDRGDDSFRGNAPRLSAALVRAGASDRIRVDRESRPDAHAAHAPSQTRQVAPARRTRRWRRRSAGGGVAGGAGGKRADADVGRDGGDLRLRPPSD